MHGSVYKIPEEKKTKSIFNCSTAISSQLSRSNQGEKDHGSYLDQLDAASIVSDAFKWWDAHLKSFDLLAAICGHFASNILGFGVTCWCSSAQDKGMTNHIGWLNPVMLRKVACLLAWTTNKCIIIILWSVWAVTAGKAPPFPYSPLHSGVDLYNGIQHYWTGIKHYWARVQHYWAGIQHYWAGIQNYWAGIQNYWAGIQHYWAGI